MLSEWRLANAEGSASAVRVHAVLVGEALMRADDPAKLMHELCHPAAAALGANVQAREGGRGLSRALSAQDTRHIPLSARAACSTTTRTPKSCSQCVRQNAAGMRGGEHHTVRTWHANEAGQQETTAKADAARLPS